jgi:hypothetical protein
MRKSLAWTRERIDKALVEAKLSDEKRTEYRKAIYAVLDRLTVKALGRINRAVKEYRFYASFRGLAQALRRKYPELRTRSGAMLKGAFDRDGTIHLDGGRRLFGRAASLEEFYAHELSHAIDGPEHEISASVAWQEAWRIEIQDGGYLGAGSMRSPREGFSEFGALLLGSGIPQRAIRQVLPRSLQVWKDWGLA